MIFTMFNSIISLGIIVGIGILQIYLSNNDNKKLGLILPGLSLIISIFAVLGIAMFASTSFDTSLLISCLIVFGAYNVPTAFLLIIYYICRNKKKKKSEITKMNIQDLN